MIPYIAFSDVIILLLSLTLTMLVSVVHLWKGLDSRKSVFTWTLVVDRDGNIGRMLPRDLDIC